VIPGIIDADPLTYRDIVILHFPVFLYPNPIAEQIFTV
jgi:hypothetical protein